MFKKKKNELLGGVGEGSVRYVDAFPAGFGDTVGSVDLNKPYTAEFRVEVAVGFQSRDVYGPLFREVESVAVRFVLDRHADAAQFRLTGNRRTA